MQPLHPFTVHTQLPIELFGVDISLTNTAIALLLASVCSTAILMLLLQRQSILPGRWQLLGELYYDFVRNMTVKNIHEHGERYVPVMFTLFTLIAGSNMIGLMPGSFAPTTQIVVTGTLAIAVFLYTIYLRIRLHGWGFFHAFAPPGIPALLLPLMVPVEILSFLARPVSLAVRLFANMTAGHTVLGVIAFFGLLAPWYIQWVPLSLSVALLGVEIFIAAIQAYIFCVLSCVYIDDAIHPHS
ncbi:MAG: F0F1 ATP synthase subunit A [Zetaproteobacteria bacterium CG12_big_fil_rev_8_21_14_0_65_55_1124]|nr:MAG: F0F1 ATP synthase subunit A [Zetaproteobacteria bacterium CG1_02_55_237]PIS20078.1 MAG: F0F1 ATP synthase subunit A [Zetaproteobacteria bacterium CG08_land_8_20_14_0_20_55_17]PIW42110.1 MAG: F0F1 ATP synthase subunit A [Zetaproteobacteria bacterium CG12_big_fil_rev_8_21_14_0_65_55_1124]PIY52934.1 MAG: F0F1 ATP synthase subunit A [Zetaproteobacteria bacterium CG_4_10_14_0_8_um_filter_55_43]PIZ39546.1 MAG: F0F1 ATP synthase subunit A [Zetaproteobacteria bacterium CG_4_10_14_0_2_um_filter_